MSGRTEQAPGHEPAPQDRPRIYVASLSDYNAGILHGTWLDATAEPVDIQAGIDQMLAASPATRRYGEPAEEWAIHDYEGFGRVRLGEWEALSRVATLAQGIVAHGDAFDAWASIEDDTEELSSERFAEAYLGEYSSVEDYGQELLDGIGIDIEALPGVPEHLQPYIRFDTAAFVRDMELGGEIWTVESEGGVHVFQS